MESENPSHYESSESHTSHSEKKNMTEKIRDNPWIISSFVLGILAFILVVGSISGGISGKVISEDKAVNTVLDFVESQVGETEVVDVGLENGLYKVTVLIQGSQVPLYITKDGKNLITGGVIPVSLLEPAESVTTDVPLAQLFIWSYCPYGVTALEPFARVASFLGDSADFEVILYYAGHGEFEEKQNKIQACIQKLEYDSYWEYAETFATEIYNKCYGDVDCNLQESLALMDSLGIDSKEVLDCVESEGDSLLEEHYALAISLGVTGSPTLMINGIKADVARTAEAYKDAVCSSFNDAPEECGVVLDSSGTSTNAQC